MPAHGADDSKPICEKQWAAVVRSGLALQERWASPASVAASVTPAAAALASVTPAAAAVALDIVSQAAALALDTVATETATPDIDSQIATTPAGVVVAPAAAIATPATAAQPSADSESLDSPIVRCRCRPAKASRSHERKQRRAHVQWARPLQKESIVSKAATAAAKARPTVQDSGSRKRKRRRKCRW